MPRTEPDGAGRQPGRNRREAAPGQATGPPGWRCRDGALARLVIRRRLADRPAPARSAIARSTTTRRARRWRSSARHRRPARAFRRARSPGPVVAFVGAAASPACSAIGSGAAVRLPRVRGSSAPCCAARASGRGSRSARRARHRWRRSVLGHHWPRTASRITTLGILILFGVGEAVPADASGPAYRDWLAPAPAERGAEAERVRIARELHDVLAHSLSQISVQAGVGLHLFDTQPDKANEALAASRRPASRARGGARRARLPAHRGRSRRPLVRNPTWRASRSSSPPTRAPGST